MADDVATVSYAWVLDGIGVVFVTDDALDDAWAVSSGFVTTHPGLQLPTALRMATNLRTLSPESTTASITVVDVLGTMAALFGVDRTSADDLITTLGAGDAPGASLYDKHVGLELLGPAGERRRYSCVPGFNIGLEHLGANEAFASGFDATPVSDGPIIWSGRRCAVYRVKYVAGAWQALANSKRVWWGTMRGGGVQHMERWTFACLGPESWLGGNLAVGNFEEGLRCLPITALTDDGQVGQTLLSGDLLVVRLDDPDTIEHSYIELENNDTYLVGAVSYDDIATAMNLFLDDLVADTSGIGGLAFDKNGNDIRFSTSLGNDGIVVQWRRGQTKPDQGDPYVEAGDSARLTAYLRIRAHEQVWRALGYDVELQNGDRDPVANSEQYGQFSEAAIPGYWYGEFYAANPKAMKAFNDGDFGGGLIENDYSSGGFDRRWPPLYPSGTVTFSGQPGQEFQLPSADPVLLAGSKSRPVMADPADSSLAFTLGGGVGVVNRQGVMVLQGPYRRNGDDEQVDPVGGFGSGIGRERIEGRTTQVVRVCWRASADGVVSTDTDGWARLVVYEWLNPRLLGFEFERLAGTWAGHRLPPPDGEPITARPIAVWDYSDEGDLAPDVLRRVLTTTGTAGEWYEDAGFVTPLFGLGGGSAFLDVGDNDDGATVPGDAETAGLGLGIPASMVALPAVWDTIPPVVGPNLGRCKVAVFGVASAQGLIKRVLAPTGFALGFQGGKFTPFDAWKFPTPTEAALTVTTETYGGTIDGDPKSLIPQQQLRKHAPIDKLAVSARREPLSGEFAVSFTRRASDFGARHRSQQIVHALEADYLLDPSVTAIGANWPTDLILRWREAFTFWATDHTVVPLSLHAEDAIDVYPGDGVTITDPWLLSSVGTYGVSVATGRVTGRVFNAVTETIKLTVMMAAEAEFRMYAPSALVTRYDENDLALGFRLKCENDELGDRGGSSNDVDGFVEPAWSTEGGAATVEVFLFDGTSWVGGIYGTVSSVTTGATDWIVLTGALTGATWYSDRKAVVVLREYANQGAAWVKRWYAPVCGKDGQHSGGTAGEKWRGL